MATAARLSTAGTYPALDPKSDRAANAAANYVTQSRLTGFGFGAEDEEFGGETTPRANITKQVLGGGRRPATGHDLASAGAAASLAHSTQGAPRLGPQRSASLRDQKRPERQLSRSEKRLSSASSKAAFLAARDSTTDLARAPDEAAIGARRDINGLSRENTVEEEDPGAMAAATGAMSDSRRRAQTAPAVPDGNICRGQALTAASTCHRVYRDEELPLETIDEGIDAGRLHNLAVAKTKRDLYGSSQRGVGFDEQARQRSLHAAAVTLAQQLYAVMPRAEEMAAAEVSGFSRQRLGGEESDEAIRKRHLHYAAEKRAAEQMAALNREQKLAREGDVSSIRTRSFLPGRLKRRSASETDATTERTWFGDDGGEDAFLMAAAQRNVDATLLDIENDISMQTGKPSPEKKHEWQKLIFERTGVGRDSDSAVIAAMTSSGPAVFDDDANVAHVARAKVRPTLDDIDARVKKTKASDIERQLDMEQKRRHTLLMQRRERETLESLGQLKAFLRGSGKKKEKKEKKKKEKSEKKKKQKKDKKGKGKAVEEEPVAVQQPQPQPPVLPARKEEEEDYGYPNGVKEVNKPPRSYVERERNGESSRSASEGSSTTSEAAQAQARISESPKESEIESTRSPVLSPPAPAPAREPGPQQQPVKKAEAPPSPQPSDLKKRKSIRRTWFKTEKRVAKPKEESPSQQAAVASGEEPSTPRIQQYTQRQEGEVIEPEAEGGTQLRQWSTSEAGESPPRSRKARSKLGLEQGQQEQKKKLQRLPEEPEGQPQGVKKEGSGRFTLFKRSKSRRTVSGSGSQGFFNVDKRSTRNEAQQAPAADGTAAAAVSPAGGSIDDAQVREPSGMSTPPLGSRRESKFQENL